MHAAAQVEATVHFNNLPKVVVENGQMGFALWVLPAYLFLSKELLLSTREALNTIRARQL